MIVQDRNAFKLVIPPWPEFLSASYRHFFYGERHITRICEHYVLLFMLEKTLLFTEDKKEVIVPKGEWYIQRPGLLQKGVSGSPAPSYFYIHFNAEEIDEAGHPYQKPPLMESAPYVLIPHRGFFDHKYLKPLFDQLDYCYRTKTYDILGSQAIFLMILNSISAWPQVASGKGLGIEVTRFLSENYNKEVRCETLAKEFNFSTEYINREMKQCTGMTPIQYLQHVRITRAMELLSNTDHTISFIAAEVGYHDVTVFYKAFYKLLEMSPGEWRNKSRRIDIQNN